MNAETRGPGESAIGEPSAAAPTEAASAAPRTVVDPAANRASGGGIRLIALDLDGVVYRESVVLRGVREALEDVLRRGLDLRYVSNNSTAHRDTVSERLAGMGLPAGKERVLTSGLVTGQWLRARLPAGAPVLVIGETGLIRELNEAGLSAYHAGELTTSGSALAAQRERGAAADAGAAPAASADRVGLSGPQPPLRPAAVVVGMDRSFSFASLAAAQAAVLGGALFVATNRDATFPTPDGLVPGSGAIVAAVATAAGREPVLMGKPAPALAEALAALTGIPAAQTLFVGDKLTTDIAMGRQAGMVTALVLTGVTTEADLRAVAAGSEAGLHPNLAGTVGGVSEDTTDLKRERRVAPLPDYVLTDMRELPGLLDRLGAYPLSDGSEGAQTSPRGSTSGC